MRRFAAPVLSLLIAACAGAPAGPAPGPRPSSLPDGGYDVVISGGWLADGTGNAAYPADLGIRGQQIAAITRPGALSDAPARERVDAAGKIVAPGFIDIQSHSRGSRGLEGHHGRDDRDHG